MDSLYLLIPLSVVIVLLIAGLLVWAVMSGQFEDLDEVGRRTLEEDVASRDRSTGEEKDASRRG
jgi:cbb3-type cytochrome oxidase maturation protein